MHRIWVVSAPETPPWGWTWKPLIMTTFLLHPRRRSLCGPLQTFAFVTCLLETFVKPLVPAVRLMGSYCCFDTDCKSACLSLPPEVLDWYNAFFIMSSFSLPIVYVKFHNLLV